MTVVLAAAPQPSWAGVLTAVALVVLNIGGLITAVSLAANRRRASRRLDAYQRDTTARLNVIHTLVNSTLTAAKQAQLDASRRELAMMVELVEVRTAAGSPPSAERLATVAALKQRVGELSAEIADRADQARLADIQIAAEAARLADEARAGQ